jgi:heme/copper-type cytochrome/quinol oxidase subunit 4
MKLFFDYLYFRLYLYCLKISPNTGPETGATGLMAGIILFYIVSIIVKISFLLNYRSKTNEGFTFLFFLILAFVIYQIIHLHYEKSKRFVHLHKKFETQSKTHSIWLGIAVLIFSLGGFLTLFLIGFNSINK